MDSGRIAETTNVFLDYLWWKNIGCAAPALEGHLDEVVRSIFQQFLRQVIGLNQEKPVEVDGGEEAVCRLIHHVGGCNIEQCQLLHALWMVERHAMSDARTAIMAHDEKFVIAELSHHVDHVLGHRAFRVGAVVIFAEGLGAIAIATQVGRDDGKFLCEARCDSVPHQVCFGIAMQQQKRRAIAPFCQVDGDFICCNVHCREMVEHLKTSSSYCAEC